MLGLSLTLLASTHWVVLALRQKYKKFPRMNPINGRV